MQCVTHNNMYIPQGFKFVLFPVQISTVAVKPGVFLLENNITDQAFFVFAQFRVVSLYIGVFHFDLRFLLGKQNPRNKTQNRNKNKDNEIFHIKININSKSKQPNVKQITKKEARFINY